VICFLLSARGCHITHIGRSVHIFGRFSDGVIRGRFGYFDLRNLLPAHPRIFWVFCCFVFKYPSLFCICSGQVCLGLFVVMGFMHFVNLFILSQSLICSGSCDILYFLIFCLCVGFRALMIICYFEFSRCFCMLYLK